MRDLAAELKNLSACGGGSRRICLANRDWGEPHSQSSGVCADVGTPDPQKVAYSSAVALAAEMIVDIMTKPLQPKWQS